MYVLHGEKCKTLSASRHKLLDLQDVYSSWAAIVFSLILVARSVFSLRRSNEIPSCLTIFIINREMGNVTVLSVCFFNYSVDLKLVILRCHFDFKYMTYVRKDIYQINKRIRKEKTVIYLQAISRTFPLYVPYLLVFVTRN